MAAAAAAAGLEQVQQVLVVLHLVERVEQGHLALRGLTHQPLTQDLVVGVVVPGLEMVEMDLPAL